MSDYGIDILALDDLTDDLRTVSGVDLLKQAAYHRITQEDLIDEQGWGINLADEVGRAVTLADIQGIGLKIAEAIQRDDRIEAVTVDTTTEQGDSPEEVWATFAISCVAADGAEFNFVVESNGLTVEILNGDVTGTS